MKKVVTIICVTVCLNASGMFGNKLSLSANARKKLKEIEQAERKKNKNDELLGSILLGEGSQDGQEDQIVVHDLEKSINSKKKNDDEVVLGENEEDFEFVVLEDQPNIIDVPDDTYIQNKKSCSCWVVLKRVLANLFKQCGEGCSSCCAIFWLGCSSYGENLAGGYYERMH